MGIEKLSDNVYSIGVSNPCLRVSDVVMQTKYGTSYNSYLITGTKNVIVDTTHVNFFNEYINNISSLVDLKSIDYIVVNHTEPDHSGNLKKLLDLMPNAKVVCTPAGYKYLKQIIMSDFEAICVKNSDTLDIGNFKLEFIVSPMLHWPDSMMTWFENDKILFSCDFLGSHFCESSLFDTDIHYKNEYLSEFKNYYNNIFSPFKKFVLDGISKIKNLDMNFICPSHGPFLTKTIQARIDDYIKWSSTVQNKKPFILIIYASAYGFTRKLADEAFDAINSLGNIDVEELDIVTTPIDYVVERANDASALIVGSCTINKDAPKPIWDVLSSLSAISSRGKPAGAFGSYGWSGEAVGMVGLRLSQLGFNFNENVVKSNFMPSDDDIKNLRNYAMEIALSVK